MSGTPVNELLARLDAAERRLAVQAADPPSGLTDADPSTGERWDAGQAWAHLAEFVPYWQRQAALVVTGGGVDPVAFGRTKADAGRIGAIEAGRRDPPADQMQRLAAELHDLRRYIGELAPEAWQLVGIHPVRGEMRVARILERFVAEHLEEHAEQLERLAESA